MPPDASKQHYTPQLYAPRLGRPSERVKATTMLNALLEGASTTLSTSKPNSPPSTTSLSDTTTHFEPSGDILEDEDEEGIDCAIDAHSQKDMKDWAPLQDQFLMELIRPDGLGSSGLECSTPGCPSRSHSNTLSTPNLLYRCDECSHGRLVCQKCCIQPHRDNVLHRVKRWNGLFFIELSLHQLGLFLDLGHDGRSCLLPTSKTLKLTVLHTNGIHTLHVKPCTCPSAPSLFIQLLRARLYPATTVNPQTCATMQYLRQCHLLKFEAQASTGSIFSTLIRITDNAHVFKTENRYRSLLTMIRQWRILKMHKRAGSAHNGGVTKTLPGGLSIICPSCPHPDIHLPQGWNDPRQPTPWLYRPILSADANFRHKNRNRAANTRSFLSGLAYFVDEDQYQLYLSAYGAQNEMSTCSGLAAVDHADSKSSHGLRSTGIGALVCARHGCWLPRGVGDLQKGERYANMNFIIFSAISSVSSKQKNYREVLISYDINCQYLQKLSNRLADPRFPAEFRPNYSIRGVIPKFHADAHKEYCRTTYSFNLEPGAGRTDGEQCERNWSASNGTSNSTKEMAAGSRNESLNDQFGDWNFTMIKGMGLLLYRRRKAAVRAAEKHETLFHELDASMSDSDRTQWHSMIKEYQSNKFLPKVFNPFVKTMSTYPSLEEVKLSLLQAEQAHDNVSHNGGTSVASFLATGLELEAAQQDLLIRVSETKSSSARQEFNILEARLALDRRIKSFRNAQAIFMPYVTVPPEAVAKFAEKANLYLPSSLEAPEGAKLSPGEPIASTRVVTFLLLTKLSINRGFGFYCKPVLKCIENHIASSIVRANYFRSQRDSRGQGAHTRLHSLQEKTRRKINELSEKYRRNRNAFLCLVPDSSEVPNLTTDDVRDLSKAISSTGARHISEGHRENSWIWRSQLGDLSSDPEMHEAVRIEWAWAFARQERWKEEVIIILEEVRRFLVTCRAQYNEWISRSKAAASSSDITSGLRAYAVRQAFYVAQRAKQNMLSGIIVPWTFPGSPRPLLNGMTI
ncbi:hypothetical protein DL93DRAFT_2172222 [Clavulina sp. PMI_390]|nr:hypothetical protein DL93DRAFT_2172222 [Clavulina sp. PMI_390]